jgi:transcriptional regulator GlxA family with amidase domain
MRTDDAAPALRRKVAILIWDGVELLDFAGPAEVFTTTDRGRAFEVYTVSAELHPVVSQGFLSINPQHAFRGAPRPDILLVPGGNADIPIGSASTMEWVRTTSHAAEITMSVCTGSLVLAAAGLLDGLEATTWHGSLDQLRTLAPRARVVGDRRFVDNGRIVTAAGVSAGIDAALHLVHRLVGDDAARDSARWIEYTPAHQT